MSFMGSFVVGKVVQGSGEVIVTSVFDERVIIL